MTKPSFQLPTTTLCTVVWYRDGHRHEQLLTTPKSNNDLRNEMLIKHRVGFSEIRAVKGVSGASIVGSMRVFHIVGWRGLDHFSFFGKLIT